MAKITFLTARAVKLRPSTINHPAINCYYLDYSDCYNKL
jgi:hypothetical protein